MDIARAWWYGTAIHKADQLDRSVHIDNLALIGEYPTYLLRRKAGCHFNHINQYFCTI